MDDVVSTFRENLKQFYKNGSDVTYQTEDSNFLYYGNILKYVMENVVPLRLYKNEAAFTSHKIKIMNVLSNFASYAIAETLENYLDHVNVAPEDRIHIKMKNEFYYERVIITFAKKSYIGLQKRKEAHIFDKPKLDVKGVNFFKSTAAEKTSSFIYKEILMNQLLRPKDGKVSLKRTYKAIHDFQEGIYNDILNGDMGFLKRSIRVKSPDAYANPMGIGQYKAVYVWNHIADDNHKIELPATVTLVKVKLRNKKDVAMLEAWPDVFKKIMNLFDNNSDIGDYMIEEDGKTKLVKGKGIKAIALPDGVDVVPDWMLAIIDVETLVADNMKLFAQLYRPLELSKGTSTLNGSSVAYYTNIVRI